MSGNLTVEAQARYRFIRELIEADFPPPARVIELGAAPGDQIATLADLGYEATAVDLGIASDDWGDGTAGRMDDLLARAGVTSVKWDLETVPYPLPDASFDVVIMTEVYEHLRDYPVRSLVEARRILRDGGRLYFTTPNAAYAMNRARLLMGRSVATPLPDWIGGLPHARHAREYTFGEVEQLMAHADLHVRLSTSRHFYLDSGNASPVGRAAKRAIDVVSRARPTLGPSIVVVAERTG
jgi:SAM-dependent methyltransferase